ncbi:membrane protein [Planotetraspora thailandica]|uniref:Membrane protein n=1 Tax=Planotetraspora thailandica TaxID=487172 RepID=A0A8J3Y2C0_9ACTN|nr:MMPL family transporter [Planotetraspora thailandica]GII59615.1 membrane protein [Planotetraspora thailandica]
MATFLYRMGKFSYRRRWLVTGLWVLLLALVGVSAGTLSGTMSNSFSIPGTEAQQAIDHLAGRFPQANAGGATARVVFAAPPGSTLTDQALRTTVRDTVEKLKSAPQVANVADPFQANTVSPDGRYAFAQVSYRVQGIELTADDRDALIRTAEAGRINGLTVEVGGDALQSAPETGIAEVIGIAIAGIVLLITFGSLVAAGLPLLTAILGVLIGLAGIMAVSGFVDINANSTILALMLGIAVGIDYALFIVSRYRHELALQTDRAEAAGRAVGTAGFAVVFAGLTVIIALAGLTVVGIPVLASMGLAAAATVALAVLVALTLLPALLGLAGRRITAGRRSLESDAGPAPAGERWARFITRHRVPALIIAVLALVLVAVPATGLRLGVPDDGMSAVDTTQRKAYDLISTGFGAGVNGPLTVVVDADASGDAGTAVARVTNAIKTLNGVVSISPPVTSPDGSTALLTVIPATGPRDQATDDLVADIRHQKAALHAETGAQVSVTGQTAVNIDVSNKINAATMPYLGLVVGLAFLLLMLVFRSVLVPIKATLGFLLSVAATFGAVVAVFQWGWLGSLIGLDEPGPIAPMVPVLLIGILFGLAMDYQVFLVTRMREDHVHGATAQNAVITGFRHGARVVTAAAIIMIAVFGGFAFADQVFIQSIGFALAFGVLVDAFIVRMTIVPAVMSLLDRAAWWLPRWLNRALPNLDIEGEHLVRQLGATTGPVLLKPEPSTTNRR